MFLQEKEIIFDWYMPAESELHAATWMALGHSRAIWGKELLVSVQKNIFELANTISAFEPVNLLVTKTNYDYAQKNISNRVNLIVAEFDDIWLRDTGPVFVKNHQKQLGAINFKFNGWGNKQSFSLDATVANLLSQYTQAHAIQTPLTLEGGNIDVDGEETALMAESCTFIDNRNPNLNKITCESILKKYCGIKKVIWLPGIAAKEITDGHIDGYARFICPGIVALHYSDYPNWENELSHLHLKLLKNALDAAGRKLKVITFPKPKKARQLICDDHFCSSYINFYFCNNALIMPEFGDAQADKTALSKMRELFPKREIVQLNIDAIASGGGGIHCITQQQPV